MKREILRLLPALILALGLVVAAYLSGGRYVMLNLGDGDVARLDRYTGEVVVCVTELGGCNWIAAPAR